MDVSPYEEGVYYEMEDYVGVWRRVLIDISDVIVAVVLCCLVLVPVLFLLPEDERVWTQAFFLVCTAVWFVYGITRARKLLMLITERNQRGPSRFLREVGFNACGRYRLPR